MTCIYPECNCNARNPHYCAAAKWGFSKKEPSTGGTNMTHPDTLQIDRAVEPEWGPQQAYAEGRSAYENSMLPNTTSAVRFNELSSSEQAFWVAHAAFRAALQPQAAVTTSGPPERDNSKPAEQQGVFRKFNVQRTDGSDQPGGKHHGCEYFVLDVAHDQHAKPALEAYAVACATTHPQLSADMQERYGLQAQASDQDPNAPWLSSAHILCTEHGIPQGEITERIDALRDKLSSPPSTEVLQAEIERLKLHIKHIGNDALRDENHALRSAITKLHAAKGRYHTQIAACDLFDVAGLKNERPVK